MKQFDVRLSATLQYRRMLYLEDVFTNADRLGRVVPCKQSKATLTGVSSYRRDEEEVDKPYVLNYNI